MLDINQIDISNIVENWLTDFNEIIEKSKINNNRNSNPDLSKSFHQDSHWRFNLIYMGYNYLFSN